jgi:hypothetical protein
MQTVLYAIPASLSVSRFLKANAAGELFGLYRRGRNCTNLVGNTGSLGLIHSAFVYGFGGAISGLKRTEAP